jgi:hypothetical protein
MAGSVRFARMTAARDWAEEEFGGAALGDRRRVDRLVRLAAAVATAPAGTVTAVVHGSAQREGAFRLLESAHVTSEDVGRASHLACIRRCAKHPRVFVPIDGSSLTFVDRVGGREVGCVGAWAQGGRGLIVTTALAVSPDGSPLGICGQRFWAREQRAPKWNKTRQSLDSETRHGVEVLDEVHARFAEHAPTVEPWFQLDRGYDAWAVLQRAHQRQMRVTVRAAYNRCVRENRRAPREYLFDLARAAPVLGHYDVEVPARGGEPARVARMQVRARSRWS